MSDRRTKHDDCPRSDAGVAADLRIPGIRRATLLESLLRIRPGPTALHLNWLCSYDLDRHGSASSGSHRDFADMQFVVEDITRLRAAETAFFARARHP